ncbi:MAG TPA: hypothetical protein VEC56_05905 [Candidatus Krumholzibacteria bacterium]|nr:hypothetical protein [Candidatus Krumholzibacteria bacterium]
MRSRSGIAVLALACAIACGCAVAPTTPPGVLPTSLDAGSGVYGAWIEVDYRPPHGKKVDVDGELLAVEDGRVYVLLGDVVRPVPIDSIQKARVTFYNPQTSAVAGLVALGTMATISNGFYLVITAPLWLMIGSGAAASRSHEPILDVPKHGWSEIVAYARFPQGMPADFVPQPVTPVVETIVIETPPKQPVAIAPGDQSAWGFAFGMGTARYDEQSDVAAVLGLNVSKKWGSLGVRFSVGNRDPVEGSSEDLAIDGEVFDLAFLVGVRTESRGVQMALRAGPAAWGLDLGDLEDVRSSFAAQGELFFYPSSTVGFGTIVAYNNNSLQDYYIVTLGIAIGPR